MNDIQLLVVGAAVASLFLSGAYVYMRDRFSMEEEPITLNKRPRKNISPGRIVNGG